MGWRLAECLVQLRAELDTNYPKRDRASDGAIGDAAHASRSSDHNPWVKDHKGTPVVTAIDIDRDIAVGFTSRELAEWLRHRRDPRLKYVISHGHMFSSYAAAGVPAWTWRKYSGANGHFEHVHVSVLPEEKLFDAPQAWGVGSAQGDPKPAPIKTIQAAPAPAAQPGRRVLRLGSAGPDVGDLQRRLGHLRVDNDYGPKTRAQVQQFQRTHKLTVTGMVDAATWTALVG